MVEFDYTDLAHNFTLSHNTALAELGMTVYHFNSHSKTWIFPKLLSQSGSLYLEQVRLTVITRNRNAEPFDWERLSQIFEGSVFPCLKKLNIDLALSVWELDHDDAKAFVISKFPVCLARGILHVESCHIGPYRFGGRGDRWIG